MSKNYSGNSLEQQLTKRIIDLERQVKALKTNQLSVIVIPKVAGDPSSPVNGQIWYNTSTNKFRKRENGSNKNFEAS